MPQPDESLLFEFESPLHESLLESPALELPLHESLLELSELELPLQESLELESLELELPLHESFEAGAGALGSLPQESLESITTAAPLPSL